MQYAPPPPNYNNTYNPNYKNPNNGYNGNGYGNSGPQQPNYNGAVGAGGGASYEKQSFEQVFEIPRPKWNDVWAGILVCIFHNLRFSPRSHADVLEGGRNAEESAYVTCRLGLGIEGEDKRWDCDERHMDFEISTEIFG